MKTIAVPARASMLNDLLDEARHRELILESADGQRFVLVSIEGWESFAVGEDDDITKNEELMKRLEDRRSGGRRVPLAQVKAQLELS